MCGIVRVLRLRVWFFEQQLEPSSMCGSSLRAWCAGGDLWLLEQQGSKSEEGPSLPSVCCGESKGHDRHSNYAHLGLCLWAVLLLLWSGCAQAACAPSEACYSGVLSASQRSDACSCRLELGQQCQNSALAVIALYSLYIHMPRMPSSELYGYEPQVCIRGGSRSILQDAP